MEPSKLALKDYLVQWLKIKMTRIEKNIYVSYSSNMTHHVITNIGMIALQKLNVMLIQEWYKSALDNGILNNSILLLHWILKTALNLAVKQNFFLEIPRKQVNFLLKSFVQLNTCYHV
ncbi:hypothetical protein P4V01_15620 [Bacillus thuringiensis]|nr:MULTISPECIES: hypothetical protein [Bacillus cereus group]MCU5454697.1 hypothetical protein [Bacillus cereus]MCU5622839.1 hypothetical protein [Bacillus cereus]MCU5678085.1 hypothetical protein [Bacillus cereus]MED1638361.1 hypothetical protein [Bacillus thuringiensis]